MHFIFKWQELTLQRKCYHSLYIMRFPLFSQHICVIAAALANTHVSSLLSHPQFLLEKGAHT